MKIERTKNSIRNIKYGLINKLVMIVGPFMVRTVFLKTLGIDYLGLNSLFSSILTIFSVAELGFGSAIVFGMYKPIAENDKEAINSLLNFYKHIYKKIGIAILILGVVLIPFLPKMINGTYPKDINLVIVYIIYLFNSVISYFLYSYLSAIMSAYQREDVISIISTTISVIMYSAQIIILICSRNYYFYILALPLSTIMNNFCMAYIAKRLFPEYEAYGIIEEEKKNQIFDKVKGLFITKACRVSRNAFDSVFISMFLGLSMTAIYNNYYYILNAVVSITSVVTSSIMAGIGNSVATESVKKNHKDFKRIYFMYMWIAGWFAICLFCLYQPFMRWWVGDEFLLRPVCVLLICLYFYILKMGDVMSVYIQATGMWWEMRHRAIAETIANVILNYCFGKFFGVEGIVSASMLSIVVFGFYLSVRVMFSNYFGKEHISGYIKACIFYCGMTVIIGGITYAMCLLTQNSFAGFLLKIITCIIVPNALFYVIYRQTKIYVDVCEWIKLKIVRYH